MLPHDSSLEALLAVEDRLIRRNDLVAMLHEDIEIMGLEDLELLKDISSEIKEYQIFFYLLNKRR